MVFGNFLDRYHDPYQSSVTFITIISSITRFFIFCRVPDVVLLKKHVLVMSFVGRDGVPAPKLKDAVERMSRVQLESAYNQVLEMMVNI